MSTTYTKITSRKLAKNVRVGDVLIHVETFDDNDGPYAVLHTVTAISGGDFDSSTLTFGDLRLSTEYAFGRKDREKGTRTLTFDCFDLVTVL
jgi:hypothetical protein